MDEKSKEIIENIKQSIREGKRIEFEDSYGYISRDTIDEEYRFIIDDEEEIDLHIFEYVEARNVEKSVLEEVRKLEDDAFDKVLKNEFGFEFDMRAVKDGLVNKYTRSEDQEDFVLCTKDNIVYVKRFFKQFSWKYTCGEIRNWRFKLPSWSAIEEKIRKALEAKKEEAKRNSPPLWEESPPQEGD